MEPFTALASILDSADVPYIAVVALPKYPTPDKITLATYLDKVGDFWYHGSDSGDISEFKGNSFFAEPDIASTYGFDGFLYKVKVHIHNPLVLAESKERALAGVGSDVALRDFIKSELFLGCNPYVLEQFDAIYAQNGPDVLTRLFGDSSSGAEWDVVATNMQRMGFDALLYQDESYTRQEVGFSVFLPEAIGHAHIIDVAPLVKGDIHEGFVG